MTNKTLNSMQFLWILMVFLNIGLEASPITRSDIVIYGGSSCGVIAAAQAAQMGKSVVLIEPSKHLGGITSSGLGWVDVNNPHAIGGLTSKYFHHIWHYYQQDASWIWEVKHPIKGQLMQFHPEQKLMWVLEPHVAEKYFNIFASHPNITVIRNEQLNRKNGVSMLKSKITLIKMKSGRRFSGKMFIDASYEGDLMAASNVSYIVGRESNNYYNETMNGIHYNTPKINIDPYIIKGNPQSGLLPRLYLKSEESEGNGDNRVQAYNYRMCLTDVSENQVRIKKPKGYDERQYEIVFRAIEAGSSIDSFFKLDLLPNRKTDSNNKGLISTDYVGMNWNYPETNYAARKQIARKHELWQRGLMWTLQNHPRVPNNIKAHYAPWGLAKDEFIDNKNWPYQLYIREARRMISPLVITEHTALGHIVVDDSIGLASYSMDSHYTKYILGSNGFLGADGGMFKKVLRPYPISYQAIVPNKLQCKNLLVPVCLSASHASYGSIRMEPTFMILGQSAATAASLAIDLNLAIQDLPYSILRQQLLADGQVLY